MFLCDLQINLGRVSLGGFANFDILGDGVHVVANILVGGGKCSQGLGGTWELYHVTSTDTEDTGIIGHLALTTFLGSSDVYFIALESGNGLVDPGKDVSTITDTGGLQEEADTEEDVCEGVGQEGDGECRSNQLPCNGGNNGGNECSQESQVEELLDTSGDAEDGFFTGIGVDVEGGYSGDEEHA